MINNFIMGVILIYINYYIIIDTKVHKHFLDNMKIIKIPIDKMAYISVCHFINQFSTFIFGRKSGVKINNSNLFIP